MAGYFKENDQLSFAPLLPVLFPDTILHVEGHGNTGDLSAFMPRATRSSLSGIRKTIDSHTLTKTDSLTYKKIFSGIADQRTIPWILGPLGFVPVLGQGFSCAGLIVDSLQRITGTGTTTPTQLAVVMAEGGMFTKTWAIEQNVPHGEFLLTNVFYNVKVGVESRVFGLYASKIALITR